MIPFIIFQLLPIQYLQNFFFLKKNIQNHVQDCISLDDSNLQKDDQYPSTKADLLLNPVLLIRRREKPSRDKWDREDPVYLQGPFSVPNNQHGKDDHNLRLPLQTSRL